MADDNFMIMFATSFTVDDIFMSSSDLPFSFGDHVMIRFGTLFFGR